MRGTANPPFLGMANSIRPFRFSALSKLLIVAAPFASSCSALDDGDVVRWNKATRRIGMYWLRASIIFFLFHANSRILDFLPSSQSEHVPPITTTPPSRSPLVQSHSVNQSLTIRPNIKSNMLHILLPLF
jgi:hypothetical protein